MEIIKLAHKFEKRAENDLFAKIKVVEKQLEHFRNGGNLKGKSITSNQRHMIIKRLENELQKLKETEILEIFNIKPSVKEYLHFFLELIDDVSNGMISEDEGRKVLNEYCKDNDLKLEDFSTVILTELSPEREQIARNLLS